MLKHVTHAPYLLIGLLLIVSAGTLMLMVSCRESERTSTLTNPATLPAQRIALKLAQWSPSQAKAAALTITTQEVGTGVTVRSWTFANPQLPFMTAITVTVPPCQYLITATVTLSLGETRSASTQFDACTFTGAPVSLVVDTYEPFTQGTGIMISAPDVVNAGETMSVACAADLSAPDADTHPITIVLSETNSQEVSGPYRASGDSVSGAFVDPYPVTHGSSPGRTLTCTLSDDRGTTQSAARTVARITPTPSPTPTATPVPLTYPGATHTEPQCVAAGGAVTTVAEGTLCKFTSATGGAICPSGWALSAYGRYATNAESQAISPNFWFCTGFQERYSPGNTWGNSFVEWGLGDGPLGAWGSSCGCNNSSSDVCRYDASVNNWDNLQGSQTISLSTGDTVLGNTLLMEIGCI